MFPEVVPSLNCAIRLAPETSFLREGDCPWVCTARQELRRIANSPKRSLMRADACFCGLAMHAISHSPLDRFYDLSRGVRSRASCQARAGMRAAAAQIQVFDRCAVARPVQQRTHGEELV